MHLVLPCFGFFRDFRYISSRFLLLLENLANICYDIRLIHYSSQWRHIAEDIPDMSKISKLRLLFVLFR